MTQASGISREGKDMEKKAGNSRQGRMPHYYLWYTCLFILLALGMFLPFWLTGRSMVWEVDGRTQYFPQMVYLRRYLRELGGRILNGNFDLKLYDFSIGMGDGIIVASRMNRLVFFSAFVPVRFLGYFYTFLVLLRIYLSGVAFSVYCRFRKMEDHAVLIGCIVYLSSGFVLRRVPMHPFFGVATIILPLMLLGVEKILQENRWIWFIFIVGGSYFAIYYYAYMCTIAVVFYFIFRYIQMLREGVFANQAGLRIFLTKSLYALGGGILGIGMAACILVPTFQHLFSSDRVKAESAGKSLLAYPIKYIGNLILGFISPNVEAGYNTRLNLIALVIPVLIILIFDRLPGLLSLRMALLLEVVSLVIPVAGFIMGAFGNVSNRWTFIVAFTLAYASVCVIQKGPVYGKITCRIMIAVAFLYAAGTLFLFVFRKRVQISTSYCMNIATGCIFLCVTVAAFLLMHKRHTAYRTYSLVTTAIAFFSAVAMGIVTYMPGLGGVVEEYMKWEELPSFYDSQPNAIFKQLPRDPFSRVDTGYNHRTWLNSSLYHDYYGIAEYNSILNANLKDYLMELENPGLESTVKILSMDGRAVCENMACVGYYQADEKDGFIPYGFEETANQNQPGSVLYQNSFPLNFAYTYDAVFPSEEYEKLSAARKQQILMKAVILDQKEIDLLPEHGLAAGKMVPMEQTMSVSQQDISFQGKARPEEDGFVLKQDGELVFPYQQKGGCECYIRLAGISYHDANEPNDNESLTFRNSFGTRKQFIKAPENDYYVPMNNMMVYMGYSDEDAADNMQIRLNGKGTCTIDSLELVYIPMESYSEDVGLRNKGGCEAPVITLNTIEGNLADGDSRFVVFPVPYLDGWKAEVDGEPVRLVKANRCYMGFYADAGKHHFKITYVPRYLTLAVAGSVLSFLAGLILLMVDYVRKKTSKRQEQTRACS